MLTDGRTEKWTPISHPATSRCDKMMRIIKMTKSSSIVDDDETILQHIKNQDWPNLFNKNTGDPNKGKGVFTGIHPIKKEAVLCDFHVELVT